MVERIFTKLNRFVQEAPNKDKINFSINKDELKVYIKHLQDLDFSTMQNGEISKSFQEFCTFLKILKLNSGKVEDELSKATNFKDLSDKKVKCVDEFKNLLNFTKSPSYPIQYSLVFVKNLKTKDIELFFDKDEPNLMLKGIYRFLCLNFNTYGCYNVNSSNSISDAEIHLAMQLNNSYFTTFDKSLKEAKIVIDNEKNNKTNPNGSLNGYNIFEKDEFKGGFDYVYIDDINFYKPETKKDIKELFNYEKLLTFSIDESKKLSYKKEEGQKYSKIQPSSIFNIDTLQKMSDELKKLRDSNKIDEVQKGLVEIVKGDGSYTGENVSLRNYIPFNFIKWQKLKSGDTENETSEVYKYNIYLSKKDGEVVCTIKKWKNEVDEDIKKVTDLEKSFIDKLKCNDIFDRVVVMFNNLKNFKTSNYINVFNVFLRTVFKDNSDIKFYVVIEGNFNKASNKFDSIVSISVDSSDTSYDKTKVAVFEIKREKGVVTCTKK